MRVSIRHREGKLMIVVYEGVLTLAYPGQERGVVSFHMKDRKLVPDSVSFVPFEIFHGTLDQGKS